MSYVKRLMPTFMPIMVVLLLLASAPAAAVVDDDDDLPYARITAPEVKRMLAENPNAVLIHALSGIEFLQQHIPKSINIPTNSMHQTTALPADKTTPLIFYCMGKRCKYSGNSSKVAVKRGYKNVYWFRGGIPEWRRFDYEMYENEAFTNIKVKKLRPHQILEALEEKGAYILDVRPLWYTGGQGYLYHSINVPLLLLDQYTHELPKNKPIIVTDGFMKQSISAAKYLIQQGFTVYGVMRGGMKVWNKNGLPTVPRNDIKVLDPEILELVEG